MDFFNLTKLTIKSFGVFCCKIEKNKMTIAPRDFYSLSFRTSGSTELISGNMRYVSEQGAVTFVPKNKAYIHNVKNSSDIIAIHFNIFEEIDTNIAVLTYKNTTEVQKLFNSLLKSWEQNPVSGDICCLLKIYKILSVLCSKDNNDNQYKNRQHLEPAVEYLRQNYTDSFLSVTYLADLAGISDAYFRRLFEQAFGMPPVKYIIKLRMENAKRLLETGFYTVSEVALRSGFESTSYFCTQFKKENSITPKEYAGIARI